MDDHPDRERSRIQRDEVGMGEQAEVVGLYIPSESRSRRYPPKGASKRGIPARSGNPAGDGRQLVVQLNSFGY